MDIVCCVRHRSVEVGSTPSHGRQLFCLCSPFISSSVLSDPEERAAGKRSGRPSVPGIRGLNNLLEPSRAPVCCACVRACVCVCLWAEGRWMSLWASTSPVCLRGDNIKARRCDHTRHKERIKQQQQQHRGGHTWETKQINARDVQRLFSLSIIEVSSVRLFLCIGSKHFLVLSLVLGVSIHYKAEHQMSLDCKEKVENKT